MKNLKSKFHLLSLLAFSLLLLTVGCSKQETSELLKSSPQAQLSGGSSGQGDDDDDTGPCDCGPAQLTFGAQLDSELLQNHPNSDQTTLEAIVKGDPDCSLEGCEGSACAVQSHKYRLIVIPTNENAVTFNDFPVVQVTDLNGGPISYLQSDNLISASYPFKATFVWPTVSTLHEAYSSVQLIPGGLCIIDVVTDPQEGPRAPDPVGEGDGDNG